MITQQRTEIILFIIEYKALTGYKEKRYGLYLSETEDKQAYIYGDERIDKRMINTVGKTNIESSQWAINCYCYPKDVEEVRKKAYQSIYDQLNNSIGMLNKAFISNPMIHELSALYEDYRKPHVDGKPQYYPVNTFYQLGTTIILNFWQRLKLLFTKSIYVQNDVYFKESINFDDPMVKGNTKIKDYWWQKYFEKKQQGGQQIAEQSTEKSDE